MSETISLGGEVVVGTAAGLVVVAARVVVVVELAVAGGDVAALPFVVGVEPVGCEAVGSPNDMNCATAWLA